MKKTLGKKLELGMKLVPIPLSLLLAGTMADCTSRGGK